jgi:hypothetical protein
MASFPQRIGYHQTCVLPATVLSADPLEDTDMSSLQADASSDGMCYLRVIDSFHDGTYLVRVAANPDLVRTQGYTVVLTEGQLASALLWDCRSKSRYLALHVTSQPQLVTTPVASSMAQQQETDEQCQSMLASGFRGGEYDAAIR